MGHSWLSDVAWHTRLDVEDFLCCAADKLAADTIRYAAVVHSRDGYSVIHERGDHIHRRFGTRRETSDAIDACTESQTRRSGDALVALVPSIAYHVILCTDKV